MAALGLDDDASVTVTLRVDDQDGGVTDATTTLTVDNVNPTVAVDNATVNVDEGETANNSGTFGDVGTADDVTISASVGAAP